MFGGDDATTGTVTNATRIYDIASNTWSSGANMPDFRAFMASGYFNNKIYLVGGYSTGNVSPAFAQVWEYDPVTNTFNTTRMDMPHTLGGAGSGVLNGHLYVAGGRDDANITLNSLYDYDIAANTWATKASLPAADNVPGAGVVNGQFWVFGGGNPFLETTGASQYYTPATDTWTAGPSLGVPRSFVAGGAVGGKLIATGGYNGSTTVTTTEVLNVGCGGTPTPTATATATATGSPTCTPGNVVGNGGFETGTFPPWVVDGTTDTPVISTAQAAQRNLLGIGGKYLRR